MPSKDYYVILGISPDESHAGVKNAFRDLARRYHPDRAGPQSTGRFQEVSEAYNVLGDRRRRTAYDASRGRSPVEPEPGVRPTERRPPVEPLDAEPEPFSPGRSAPEEFRHWSLMDDFMAAYAARDAVFDEFTRSFVARRMPKSGRVEALHLGIHLTPDEARRGVDVEIDVPIFLPCRDCHGNGRIGLFPCVRCAQTGWFELEEPVAVRIPPMVRDGAVMLVSLGRLGIENIIVRLRIRVRP